MKRDTAQFLARLRKNRSVRDSISKQVNESRYYAYAQTVKGDSKIRQMAEGGELYALTNYLYSNQTVLEIPVRLSIEGCRRLARTLIQS